MGFINSGARRCVEALAPQVRPKYLVDLDENVYLHELGAHERRLVGRPDTFVIKSSSDRAETPATPSVALMEAPIYTRVPDLAIDDERLDYLKILDRETREVVTVIELLSPVNKGSGHQEYLAKRQRYLDGGVGLVEIDLLRGGRRLPLENPPECDYCVMVVRPKESPVVGVWPLKLRQPLPQVPVPLRNGDQDAKLDLLALLNGIYDAVGYADYLYELDPEPPLSKEDAVWAKELIQST